MNNPNATDNLKPFKKGNDPRRNLEGRPKGSRSLTVVLREIIEADKGQLNGKEVDGAVLLMATLYKKAIKDGDLASIREILDRLEGKPLQKTENTNDNHISIQLDEPEIDE